MGRLDDAYQQLQGGKPMVPPSDGGMGAGFGVVAAPLKTVAPPQTKADAAPAEASPYAYDLGTKKDPSKLRKQVVSKESADSVAELLKDPTASASQHTTDSSTHNVSAVPHASNAAHAAPAQNTEIHDKMKFATGAGFNQAKFTKRIGRYVVDKSMAHIDRKEIRDFAETVGRHARVVSSGQGLGRAARMRIRSDLTSSGAQEIFQRKVCVVLRTC